ncbi:MAG: gamma-glutamyl-gamma-aminobutyrate hydrolase family protein [Planctomycetes bacterium]|nr:gamma-glutamyl-gamma-aminobutyrate hydrolase family protein [Planctomycetota bacterium]
MKKTSILFCLILIFIIAGCNTLSRQKPLIGITSVYKDNSNSLSYNYIKAVEQNNGIPLILPTVENEETIETYINKLDGLVLIGGADIPPSAYNQAPHPTVKIMADKRYNFERRLIKKWLNAGKPVLGICLGMQFTNVVSGGTMIQDIPSQIGKKVDHRCKEKLHKITIDPSSNLAKILNSTQAHVYSTHHQAVKEIGRNLKPVAKTDDGIVEALERTDGCFGLFVQWHPEAMTKDIEHRDAIYSALIKACLKSRK